MDMVQDHITEVRMHTLMAMVRMAMAMAMVDVDMEILTVDSKNNTTGLFSSWPTISSMV